MTEFQGHVPSGKGGKFGEDPSGLTRADTLDTWVATSHCYQPEHLQERLHYPPPPNPSHLLVFALNQCQSALFPRAYT